MLLLPVQICVSSISVGAHSRNWAPLQFLVFVNSCGDYRMEIIVSSNQTLLLRLIAVPLVEVRRHLRLSQNEIGSILGFCNPRILAFLPMSYFSLYKVVYFSEILCCYIFIGPRREHNLVVAALGSAFLTPSPASL